MTGPESATAGVVVFYDVFGFFPQTLQGADILAYSNTERPNLVLMPDFLKGNPAKIEWFPPDTDEKKAESQTWMGENLSPDKHLSLFEELYDAAAKQFTSVTGWGVMGYCWGGKMVSLIAARDKPIKAGVQSSPAMIDPSDGEKAKIPMMILASKDESVEAVKKFEEALSVTKQVEIFDDQVHGWMSARADFANARAKAEYERGYKLAVEFFNSHL